MPDPAEHYHESADGADLTAIARSAVGALGCCDDAPLARALLRELANGEPITDRALAAATGRKEGQVSAILARWPNVERDAQRRVVAFSGLTLRPTAHRVEVAGRELFAWCAWDTLFLPALLEQPARVQSRCPVTDTDVRLTVEPDGVRERNPEALRVSLPRPGAVSTEDVTGSFCCHVHFLAGTVAAELWLAEHRGGAAVTLDEAFELGRLATQPLRAGAP